MMSWEHSIYVPPPPPPDVYHELCPVSNNRQMRNKAEKQRRDKLNSLISELAHLVPMVAQSPRRMDKTSILRLSATFLRMYRCLPLKPGEIEKPFLPFLETLKVSQVLLDFLHGMEGFLLVVTGTGKIVFVTHTVEKLLGHTQNDLLGQSLYNITRPEDHEELRRNIETTPSDGRAPSAASGSSPALTSDESSCEDGHAGSTPSSSPSASRPGTSASTGSLGSSDCGRGGLPFGGLGAGSGGADHLRRSFYIHLSQRSGGRAANSGSGAGSGGGSAGGTSSGSGGPGPAPEQSSYELVHVVGFLQVPRTHEPPPTTHRPRRHRDTVPSSNSENVLVAVVQLFREKKVMELSLLEATLDEYQTRHLKDGSIVYSDHRISVVAGYMSDEVSGHNAFSFMHKDDMTYALIALQQMFDKNEPFGSSTYRLMTKNGQYIYMKTRGYLEYASGSKNVETFVCINTLLSEEEGEEGLREMKQRFSAYVSALTATGGEISMRGIAAAIAGAAMPTLPPPRPPAASAAISLSSSEISTNSALRDPPTAENVTDVFGNYSSRISPTESAEVKYTNHVKEESVNPYHPAARPRAVSEGEETASFNLQNFVNLFKVPEEQEPSIDAPPSTLTTAVSVVTELGEKDRSRSQLSPDSSPRHIYTPTQRPRAVSESELQKNGTDPPFAEQHPSRTNWTFQRTVDTPCLGSKLSETLDRRPPDRPTVITGRCCAGSSEKVRCSRLERTDQSEKSSSTSVCGQVTVLKRPMSAIDVDNVSSIKKLNVGPRSCRQRHPSERPPTEALRVEVNTLPPDELQRIILSRDSAMSLYTTQPTVLVSQHRILRTSQTVTQSVTTASVSPSPLLERQSPTTTQVTCAPPTVLDDSEDCSCLPQADGLSLVNLADTSGLSVGYQDALISPDHGESDSFSSLGLPDPESNPEVLDLLDGTELKLNFDTLQEVRGSSGPEASPGPESAVVMERYLAQKHLQLESCMQLQETQMHCIEQDLTQLPLADRVFRSNLTQLQASGPIRARKEETQASKLHIPVLTPIFMRSNIKSSRYC